MPKGPAARVGDSVAHPLPPMLVGSGSNNVLIGGKPAWRGIPLGAVAALQTAKMTSDITVQTAVAATAAASGTPGYAAAKAAEETTKATAASTMAATIKAAAASAGAAAGGTVDTHTCQSLPPPAPPPLHGPGVVIDGSATVLINGCPAARLGDTVLESFGPPNKIVMGQPNVVIGP